MTHLNVNTEKKEVFALSIKQYELVGPYRGD